MPIRRRRKTEPGGLYKTKFGIAERNVPDYLYLQTNGLCILKSVFLCGVGEALFFCGECGGGRT